MPLERYLARQEKLLSLIREAEVDALLVTGVANVSYLTGFSGDSSRSEEHTSELQSL